MKIGIVGAGAMGCVYAALMADAGNEVWAIDTWQAHVDAISANGLRLEGASGDRTVALGATTDSATVGPCDLVIIATKAAQVEAAATGARALLGPEAAVLTIQNGLGSAAKVAGVLGQERVIIGVVGGFGASIKAPGHAHHNGMELVRLGEASGAVTPRLERIAALWQDAGFTVKCFDDIDQLVWEKLICNVCYSGTATLTGLTVGEIMADADAWPIASRLRRRGLSGRPRQGHPARFRRPRGLRAGLRRQDPRRTPLDAAGPPRWPPLGDRRDQRRDPA